MDNRLQAGQIRREAEASVALDNDPDYGTRREEPLLMCPYDGCERYAHEDPCWKDD